jgi:Spy/CpxP family protein refolding chaperone
MTGGYRGGMMGGYRPGMMMGGYGGPMAALKLTDEQQDKLFALQERTARRTGIR